MAVVFVKCAVSETPGPTFDDAIELVRTKGWIVNFRTLCPQFELKPDSNNCYFKQISWEAPPGSNNHRGLNVPTDSSISSMILYHARPLSGIFFVVTSKGSLIRAYVITRGTDYALVPNGQVEHELEAEKLAWVQMLPKLRVLLPKKTDDDERARSRSDKARDDAVNNVD